MKRTTSLLMAVIIIITAISIVSCDTGSVKLEYRIDKVSETVTITGQGSAKGKWVTIPEEIDGYPVTAIGEYAFKDSTFEQIILPTTITSIGRGAFYNCKKLFALHNLEKCIGLEKIEREVFYGCEYFIDLNLPESIKEIGDYAFYKCTYLYRFSLPSRLESIGDYAFYACLNLSPSIPDSVTHIGECAFLGCYSISQVVIPSRVTRIENWSFSQCANLEEIAIPEGVNFIGEYAFYLCEALDSVNIPSTVLTIGVAAFADCKMLKQVTVPEGVRRIDVAAFANTSNLKSIYLPKSLQFLGDKVFLNNMMLIDIYYAGTVDEWNAISKGDAWNEATANYTIHCADGDISKDGAVTYK